MLDLKESLELLEITDISQINEKTLATKRKRALRRWHPDTIAFTSPDQATIEKFEDNFRNIDDAVETVKAFIQGEIHIGERTTGSYEAAESEEPEDVIRRNAADMQGFLREKFASVKDSKFKMEEKLNIVNDGVLYGDLLDDDLKENAQVLSISSFFNGIILYIIFGILTSIFFNGAAANFTLTIIGIWWFLHSLCCIVAFLPLSRFWLPDTLGPIVFGFVDVGLMLNRFAVKSGLNDNLVVGLILGIPIRLAQLFKWIILFPIYKIASIMLGDKRMGVLKEKTTYYSGLADWYIDMLINKNPREFESEELFDLSYINAEFKEL